MPQWLIDNGIQITTLIAMVVLVAKVWRWSGIQETRITNLEGWMQNHIDHHPGKS